jgi:hypothetical protein
MSAPIVTEPWPFSVVGASPVRGRREAAVKMTSQPTSQKNHFNLDCFELVSPRLELPAAGSRNAVVARRQQRDPERTSAKRGDAC